MISLPIIVILLLIGASLGSFFGAWVDRYNTDRGIPSGRSRCDKCFKEIRWYDLIPLISYPMLGGKCRQCKEPISPFKIVVEIFFAVVFIIYLLYRSNLLSPQWGIDLISIVLLSGLFFFDLRYMRLPDRLVIPLIILGIVSTSLTRPEISYLLLSLIPAIIFAIMYWGSKGRWVGFGDVKLLLALGLLALYPLSFLILFASILIGAVISVVLLLSHKAHLSTKIPFGSVLALVAIISIIFINAISQTFIWYLF